MNRRKISAKSKRRKDLLTWWRDRIKVLRTEADRLYQQDQTVYEVGFQAVSKLAILAYYIDMYTRIIKNQFKSKSVCFIDLFAGCGLCKIKESGDIILGSASIAYHIPQPNLKFDRIILFEKNPSYSSVLKKRIQVADVIQGDVNDIQINKILSDLCGNNNPVLAFIDPEGLELKWRTLEQILNRWSDVIINYHPVAVRRVHGMADKLSEKLTEFYGSSEWQEIKDNEEEFLNLYMQRIKRFKDIVTPIKVRGKSYYYYILITTRKTKGNNPWLKAVDKLKKFIEGTKGDMIDILFKIYHKKQEIL